MSDTSERSRRLGRGLGALLGTHDVSPTPTESGPTELPISFIDPNPLQPRRQFKETELEELADSLRTHGLLQPVTVRKVADRYQLVAGERRLRAAKLLGWAAIPAIVREVDDKSMLALALVENLQRDDLDPLEEAEGYKKLLDQYGLTQDQVARAVGKSRPAVANALRLLTLPRAVQEMLRSGALTAGHARALLALPPSANVVAVARRIVQQGLTVRQVEELARGRQSLRRPLDSARPLASQALVRHITDRLRRRLQTDVRVVTDANGKGEIRVRFYSMEDLERLTELLAGPPENGSADLND
ncbi:MAG TPA: ParB/RepB/Spo0J family partition protein [Gemmatimonadaceae bacterium]|nr:ParB/RepB/Spo0J family partition protein [Gemmatimonadaceae bacterium]